MNLKNIKNIDELYYFLKNNFHFSFKHNEKYDGFFEKLFSILYLVNVKKIQLGVKEMPIFGLREFYSLSYPLIGLMSVIFNGFFILTLIKAFLFLFDFKILKPNEMNFFDLALILFSFFISFLVSLLSITFFPACSRYILLNKKSFISMVIYSDSNEDDKDILLNEFNKLAKEHPNKSTGKILRLLFSKIEEDYNKVKKDIETKEKEQQDVIKIKEKFENIQKQLKIQKYLLN